MPLTFRKTLRFQSRPEERIDEFNFIGGLVTDKHETKLEPNQSPNMHNVVFNETGSIKTRGGTLRYNGDPIGSSSDEANTGASTGTITLDAPGDYAAQTFQVSTIASIVQCDFYLAMNTSGEQQLMKAELWSGSTGPSANLIDGQILLVSGTSETEYSFRFRVPYELAATTEYAVVLKPYASGQTINTVLVHRTGNSYASGGAYTSTDSGLTWSAVSNVDLKFNVYTGTTAGTGLIRFYGSAGIQQTIAKFGTSLYRGDDQTGALTVITLGSGSSLVSGNYIDSTVSNGTLLVVDKSGFIQKYRGSTNSNYTTGTISVTNGSATVTGSGTSWNTSTNAVAGEYIKLPDGKWYRILSIASDTSLTIETSYQGSTQSGQNYTVSPWGEVQGSINSSAAPASLVRPTPDFIETHQNRVFTLDGNTLRYSVLDTSVDGENFNDWDTSNNAGAIIIPSGKNNDGTGIYSFNNVLFVFQRRAIWGLYGNSPGNFELRNISNEIGMIDKKTLVEYNDILTFLSDKGLIIFDGSNIVNVSDNVVNNLIEDWANKTSPTAFLWDNRYVISYTESGGSYNSQAIYYDYTRQVFGKLDKIYASAWSVWQGGTDSGEIYFTSSNQGSIYRFDVGGHDDGYEIETLYDTPSLSYGSGTNDKTVKKVYLQQMQLGDYDMTVKQLADINQDEISKDINLSPGSVSLWGDMNWGDNWSSQGSITTDRIAEFQGLAKYYKYRMEQSGYDEGVEILGITLTSRMRRLT